jgi:hypothetical protein
MILFGEPFPSEPLVKPMAFEPVLTFFVPITVDVID